MNPDFIKADAILREAAEKGRFALFEHEFYDLLAALGIGSPPTYVVLGRRERSLELLEGPQGEKLVLKIVHPRVCMIPWRIWLFRAGIPVFRSADEAVRVFGRWAGSKKYPA
jgi:hypothetical protein